MLGFFKGKSKDNIIYSPCKGKVVPITEVSDPTFSEKVLGDGFAVIPSEGKIYAPADGEISMVFDTLHAESIIQFYILIIKLFYLIKHNFVKDFYFCSFHA